MGLMDNAKNLMGGAADQVDGAVDAAADAIKEKTPDQIDGVVDQGAEKVKEVIKDQLN
jgi:uncharacterized protein YjbJ (UPF0337 family)